MIANIKPEFYNAIRKGEKTIEYRKTKILFSAFYNTITFKNIKTNEKFTADIEKIEILKVDKIDIQKMTVKEVNFLAEYYKNEEWGVLIYLGKIN